MDVDVDVAANQGAGKSVISDQKGRSKMQYIIHVTRLLYPARGISSCVHPDRTVQHHAGR